MHNSRHSKGFSVAELLTALVILGILMAAVAVAFDAAVTNFHNNEGLSKTTNTARAALLRLTTDIRTARSVAIIGAGGDPDNQQCSLITADGRDITYHYDAAADTLMLITNDDATDSDYVLCRNVSAVTFNRATVPSSSPAEIRNVRIMLTLADDASNVSQTMAAAAVVRRNL